MKEQLHITIPEPCHEDWNQMTPVEQGRHCAVCQKNVVDFSNQDDEAIIDFFKNYNGSTCGRFADEQLNRPLQKIEFRKAPSFLRYAAGLLLPGLLLAAKSNAQKGKLAVITKGDTIPKIAAMPLCSTPDVKSNFNVQALPAKPIEQVLTGRTGGVVFVQQNKIQGRVVDERDGSNIPSASIQIKGSNIGTVTDAEGGFSIHNLNQYAVLIISSVGYESSEITVKKFIASNYQVKLKPIFTGLSGVVVVGNNYKRVKVRLGGAIAGVSIYRHSILDTVKNKVLPNKVKLYPNPVSINGTVQLSFSNLSSGLYQIRMLNEAGQLFYAYQKQISSKNETEQIHLNERMTPGLYIVQIINDKKKLVQTLKLIVQN